MRPGFEVEVINREPEQFLASQAGIDERRHHRLHLGPLPECVQLLIDLRERQKSNLAGPFPVPLDAGSRVLVAWHADSPLLHRPIEKADKDFAITVRGFRRESASLDVARNERGNRSRRNLLEKGRFNDLQFQAAIDARFGRAFFACQRELPACDFQGRANRAERFTEVIDVRLSAFRGFDNSNVFDVSGNDFGNRRSRRQWIIRIPELRGFELPKLFFCQLQAIGPGGNPPGLSRDAVLDVVGAAAQIFAHACISQRSGQAVDPQRSATAD